MPTCTLGHPMAEGQAVCPACGMGPVAAAAPQQPLQPQQPQPAMSAAAPPPPSAPVLSPDGQWMWNGAQWVPAAAAAPPPPPVGYASAPYPMQAPVQSSGTNGLAIASLVLGILWLGGLGAVLAVIFGHISKRQIRERGEGGSGLSTAGLILGYLGIAGALFLILTLAVFTDELSKDRAATVKSDLRNAATAEESYLTDYDTYTNDIDSLSTEGLQTSLGTQLILGYDGYNNYCMVGSYVGEDDWYLYDSQDGGLQPNSYGSSAEAEAACSDPAMAFAY